MIVIPNVPNYAELLERHFRSPVLDGHSVLVIDCRENISKHLEAERVKGNDDGKEIYTLGFDWSSMSSELTFAIYNCFPNRKIITVPKLEEPDRVQYIYKQKDFPNVDACYNAEPYITHDWKTARLYYNSVCHPSDFDKGGLMVEDYGDFWNVNDSEYEKQRMRSVRDIIARDKIKHVFDVGSYLGQLADLLEMNSVDVVRTDIALEVLHKDIRVLNLRMLSLDDIANLINDCVLFASVLFAYDPLTEPVNTIMGAINRKKPKYIVYEDSALNFNDVFNPNNKWVEYFGQLGYYILGEVKQTQMVIEPFYGRKNIRRHGSVAMILKHYGKEAS